jgi:hypothetical protein
MPNRFDVQVRLEAVATARDPGTVREALRAAVHDPAWFLGRQWQRGEHDGTDASSPGLVHMTVTETPITGRSAAPEDDPRVTPPESVIESELDQWWTIGRRARVGEALGDSLTATQRVDPAFAFAGLPSPYDSLNGRIDGRALWFGRTALDLDPSLFAELGVPGVEPADDWQPAELAYSASFAAGPVVIEIPRHDGGDVDWYSARATGGPLDPLQTFERTSYPTRVEFPGAPKPRWWQIEDHRVDPGAVAPDRTRLASLLTIHATASHSDDWFTAPLRAPTGTVVSVRSVTVVDVMGVETVVQPAIDWSLFHVTGLDPTDLLLWPTVQHPLSAARPLDEIRIGVDEDANLLWAVEERVDGVDVSDDSGPIGQQADVSADEVVLGGRRRYRYDPATGVELNWHPYVVSEVGGERRYVLARLADLSVRPVTTRPGPTSALLRDPAATPTDPDHLLHLDAVPRRGVRLDRRYVLGRRTDGSPVLWVQRRRLPLTAPPISSRRSDVVVDIT